MKDRLKVALKYAPFGLLTLVLTVYFMFLTFPYAEVQHKILPQLEAGLPCSISIERIGVTPLLWVKLSGVQVFPKTGGGTSFADIPVLKIRPSLLSLLIGNWKARFRANLLDGTLKGKISRKKDGDMDLALTWDEIQPGKHPLLAQNTGMLIAAEVSGDLDLRIKGNNWMTSNGTLSLDLSGGSVKGLQVSGFTLPPIENISGGGTVRVSKQKAEVESLSLKSDEMSASLSGDMTLSPRLVSSRLNLTGRLKLTGQLQNQYQAMLNTFLRKKDTEGFYTFSLKGTLGSPRFSG